jgi:hypothetical protein
MRFTARSRLETWAQVSRTQSDEATYGLLEPVSDHPCGSAVGGGGSGSDGAWSADMDAVEHASREGWMEMTDDAFRQLMKHAHRLAMDGHGELAQMLRDAIMDARRYSAALTEIGAHRVLIAACNRLNAEAEEYSFDDGLGRGAMLDYWYEFDQALERGTEIVEASLARERGEDQSK